MQVALALDRRRHKETVNRSPTKAQLLHLLLIDRSIQGKRSLQSRRLTMLIALLIGWIVAYAFLVWRARGLIGALPRLPEVGVAAQPRKTPGLSIIVPARNEACNIESAMTSLLAQTYPYTEIIAINDHSTDATGKILDRLALSTSRLRVIHDPPLPPGWLGKPNALHRGAQQATGEWFLFTDADIVFTPDACERAMAAVLEQELSGITLLPTVDWNVWAIGAQYPWLVPLGALVLRPQDSNREQGEGFAAGAFMLVRRSVYDAIGGHTVLKSAVLDDVEFGRLIMYDGHDAAHVKMYHDTADVFFGAVKNISFLLGGKHGRPLLAPLGSAGLATFISFPFSLVWYATALGNWYLVGLGAFAYLLPIAVSFFPGPIIQITRHHLFLYPLAVWIVLGATVVASYYRLRNDAILWRGRKIPLDRSTS
jgi:glycosyltransferase involved in cell wall biosynthesis